MTNELTREELEAFEHGYRSTTKAGGYESIPTELAEREAKHVGLSSLPVVEVKDEEGVEYAYFDKTPEGRWRVVIPRRMPKWEVPGALRHELAHVKLEHPDTRKSTYGELAKVELEALRLGGGGKLTSNNITDVALTLHIEEGLSQRDATSVAYWAAKDLGASPISLGRALSYLRRFFSNRKKLKALLKDK